MTPLHRALPQPQALQAHQRLSHRGGLLRARTRQQERRRYRLLPQQGRCWSPNLLLLPPLPRNLLLRKTLRLERAQRRAGRFGAPDRGPDRPTWLERRQGLELFGGLLLLHASRRRSPGSWVLAGRLWRSLLRRQSLRRLRLHRRRHFRRTPVLRGFGGGLLPPVLPLPTSQEHGGLAVTNRREAAQARAALLPPPRRGR